MFRINYTPTEKLDTCKGFHIQNYPFEGMQDKDLKCQSEV